MAFFNSNKSRAAMRRVSGNNYQRRSSNCSVTESVYITKKQADVMDLGFTGYSLKYGDVMIIGDINYMLPDYRHDIEPDNHNIIRNDVFEGIKCDKVCLIYSPKLKKFVYLTLNDDYSIGILFKSDNYHSLPNVDNIDLDNLHPNIEVKENANRLLNSIYNRIDIADLTSNPILFYRVGEIFKR